jgi:hypothetical protein
MYRSIVFEAMKKVLLIIVLSLSFLVLFLVSCSKEDKKCKCTIKEDGDTWIEDIYPINFNANNCSDLQTKLSAEYGISASVSCK